MLDIDKFVQDSPWLPDDGLRLGDVVTLLVWGGVSVGVGNQGESCTNLSISNTADIRGIQWRLRTWVDVVRLGSSHEIYDCPKLVFILDLRHAR